MATKNGLVESLVINETAILPPADWRAGGAWSSGTSWRSGATTTRFAAARRQGERRGDTQGHDGTNGTVALGLCSHVLPLGVELSTLSELTAVRKTLVKY